jgi:hypothetical protein
MFPIKLDKVSQFSPEGFPETRYSNMTAELPQKLSFAAIRHPMNVKHDSRVKNNRGNTFG